MVDYHSSFKNEDYESKIGCDPDLISYGSTTCSTITVSTPYTSTLGRFFVYVMDGQLDIVWGREWGLGNCHKGQSVEINLAIQTGQQFLNQILCLKMDLR